MVFLENVEILPALDCFRPCLDNKQLICFPVFCPFHVHRLEFLCFCGIISLYYACPLCKLQYFIIVQDKLKALCILHFNICCCPASMFPVNHFYFLAAELFAYYGPESFL